MTSFELTNLKRNIAAVVSKRRWVNMGLLDFSSHFTILNFWRQYHFLRKSQRGNLDFEESMKDQMFS